MSNYPLIRFSGYSKPWADCKLKEYSRLITKGTTPKTKDSKGNINYIKVENLQDGKISTSSKVSENEHLSFLKRSILHEGDILFSIAGTLGRAAIVTKTILPANTNQALAIIRGYDFNSDFLLTSLGGKVVRDYVRKNPTIGAQPNLSLEQVGNLIISSPCLEEQKKIGTFFKNLDDTISLHQQELEALKQTKQGFLQKMFPKDGENIPQFRFDEFTKPWTKIEFEKVIKLVGGATPLKENKEYWNGDIVWLSSQEIKNKYVSKGTYLITEQAVKDNRTKVVSEGTPLIVTRSGILAKRFPISISLNEVAINQDIKALIFDRERFDTEFLVAELKSKESYILKNIVKTGTTVQSVNLPDLNRMNLYIPEYAEQLKIGEFFRQLDEVIELKEKELEALKETKKGFLQKMFI